MADDDLARYHAERAAQMRADLPREFRDARVSIPDVRAWSEQVVTAWWPGWPSATVSPFDPALWEDVPLTRVPGLLLTGPTGTGKTYQAYAAIREIMRTGVRMSWAAIRTADLLDELRPRAGASTYEDFHRYAGIGLLLLDDVDAARSSGWTEEILDRLVDYRWTQWRPTIYTTNRPVWAERGVDTLESMLSARLFSRLASSTIVPVAGEDRRLPPDSTRE